MPLSARDLKVGDVLDRRDQDEDVSLWNPPAPPLHETISEVEVHDTYVKVTFTPCGSTKGDGTYPEPVIFLPLGREVHPLNRRKDKQ